MEHCNLAAVFEPGRLLRLGSGFAVQSVNTDYPAMVHQASQSDSGHYNRRDGHGRVDIFVGGECAAGPVRAWINISCTGDCAGCGEFFGCAGIA